MTLASLSEVASAMEELERNRQAFVRAISDFLERIELVGLSDREISRMMTRLESFAPHSELSGIIFYGERARTPNEMAEEALLRERLWTAGGDAAVTDHIENRMRAALADPTTEISNRYSAMNILAGIERARKT